MTEVLILAGPPIVLLMLISGSKGKFKDALWQANSQQRDRNAYLAGYRTRTVNDQRTAWNYDTGTTFYSVPVQENIRCFSQENIDAWRADAKKYKNRTNFWRLIFFVGPFTILPLLITIFEI